jgi:hypothetical protein
MNKHAQIQIQLSRYRHLDHAEKQAVDHHLATCPVCAAKLTAYQQHEQMLTVLVRQRQQVLFKERPANASLVYQQILEQQIQRPAWLNFLHYRYWPSLQRQQPLMLGSLVLVLLCILTVATTVSVAEFEDGWLVERYKLAQTTPAPASASPVIPAAISQLPESPLGVPPQEDIESLPSEIKQLTRFSGLAIYSGLPAYEVWYDAEIWQFIENDEPGLVNLKDSNCYLSLRGKAGGGDPVDAISLAGRVWTIFGGADENGEPGSSIVYSTLVGGGGYLFRIDLPEPYQEGEKSSCEQLAEEVIDTFIELDKEPVPTSDPNFVHPDPVMPPAPPEPGPPAYELLEMLEKQEN